MAKRRWQLAAGILVQFLAVAADTVGAAGQSDATYQDRMDPSAPRVRTDHPIIAMLIRDALDRSATFRWLVIAIQATDGVVYVEQGRCGHNRRACLPLSMAVAGPNRVLRVIVERLEPPTEAAASIAHELRHALEVLEQPGITSGDLMYFFYKSHGSWRGDAFETPAAVRTGNAVRQELRRR